MWQICPFVAHQGEEVRGYLLVPNEEMSESKRLADFLRFEEKGQ